MKIPFQRYHEFVESEINGQFLRSLYYISTESTEEDEALVLVEPMDGDEKPSIFRRFGRRVKSVF